MWVFNTTPQFVRSVEDLNLSEEIQNSLKEWGIGVQRIPTPRTKCYFRSPNNVFEIWTARIPDPQSNRGRSGGFRLVYFFQLKEGAVYLDRMEMRADLGGRTERPRDQAEFTAYLEELKKELMKVFENGG